MTVTNIILGLTIVFLLYVNWKSNSNYCDNGEHNRKIAINFDKYMQHLNAYHDGGEIDKGL